jgi:hypothetical protein
VVPGQRLWHFKKKPRIVQFLFELIQNLFFRVHIHGPNIRNYILYLKVIYKHANFQYKFYVAKNIKDLKLIFVCLWDKSLATSEIDFL